MLFMELPVSINDFISSNLSLGYILALVGPSPILSTKYTKAQEIKRMVLNLKVSDDSIITKNFLQGKKKESSELSTMYQPSTECLKA